MASASGWVERKRFLFSSHPELKERLAGLQEIVRDFQKQYPELISLSIYGSLIKGYATPESDIDGVIILDEEVQRELQKKNPQYSPFSMSNFYKALKEKLSLTYAQMSIQLSLIDKKDLLLFVQRGDIPRELFFLSIGGRKISQYRKVILDQLEAMGEQGEETWRNFGLSLLKWEWGSYNWGSGGNREMGEKRKKLYPWTIAEAKKYFLHGGDDLH